MFFRRIIISCFLNCLKMVYFLVAGRSELTLRDVKILAGLYQKMHQAHILISHLGMVFILLPMMMPVTAMDLMIFFTLVKSHYRMEW